MRTLPSPETTAISVCLWPGSLERKCILDGEIRVSDVKLKDRTCHCTLLFCLRKEKHRKHFGSRLQIKADVQMGKQGRDAVRDETEDDRNNWIRPRGREQHWKSLLEVVSGNGHSENILNCRIYTNLIWTEMAALNNSGGRG